MIAFTTADAGSVIALVVAACTAAGGLMMRSAWRAEREHRLGLQSQIADFRVERAEMETRFQAELNAKELRCREETSLLRGRLDALSDSWLERMAERLGERIAGVLAEHLKRGGG